MLPARSVEEAHLYLDLHFCSRDHSPSGLRHWLERREGVLVAVYEGPCETCGAAGRFEFTIDTTEELPALVIGGATPSRIIDPGEFLWLSDNAASHVPVDPSGLSADDRRTAQLLMQNAISALEEVRKFVPDDASEVPEGEFTSELGRSVRTRSPERFRTEELDERLEYYRRALVQLRS